VGERVLAVESGPYDSTFGLTEPTLITVLDIDSGEELGAVELRGMDLLVLD
jgi:hypothetical protein